MTGLLASFSISVAIVMIYALSLLVPAMVSTYFSDYLSAMIFAKTSVCTFTLCAIFVRCTHYSQQNLRLNSGLLIVVLTWLMLAVVSLIPFLLILDVSLVDAWFEAVSGLTTTGIEAIGSVDLWPKGLLWYRQQLEWIGGVGVVIMSLTILSLYENSLMSLYSGEFGSDVRQMRMTPRLMQSARYVCAIYGVGAILCTLSFVFVGVPVFDAILEAMATVSTGGFSVVDIRPDFYEQTARQLVSVVFMILGAIGMHAHYHVWKHKSLKSYLKHAEVRLFLGVIAALWLLALVFAHQVDAMRVLFDVVAFVSTTGFSTVAHHATPLVGLLFILSGLVGACAGSTAGGIKLIRAAVLFQESRLHLMQAIYPNSVWQISIDGTFLSKGYVASIRGYIALFVVTFCACLFAAVLLGMDLHAAFYWVACTITNVGATISGTVSYADLLLEHKLLLSWVMLAGRVEMVAFLVVLLPGYWRQ